MTSRVMHNRSKPLSGMILPKKRRFPGMGVVLILFGIAVWRGGGGVHCLSISGRHSRAENAMTLQRHLKQRGGRSRVDQDTVSVVAVGRNECGIMLNVEESRPLAATDGINEKKEIIYVDRDQFLTPSLGKDTWIGRAVTMYLQMDRERMEKWRNILPSIHLALYLCLQQATGKPKLATYFKTLPSLDELGHLPIFWTNEALSELQGSSIRLHVENRQREWKEDYDMIQEACSNCASANHQPFAIDLDAWFWARSIISSRSFTDEEMSDEPCLVPYVDMMNHLSDNNCKSGESVKCNWEIDALGYHLLLPEGYPFGGKNGKVASLTKKQLGISYGARGNVDMLLNYGFCELGGPKNAVLHLKLSNTSSDRATKELWEADGLGDCHLEPRKVALQIGLAGPAQSALSLCRVACAEGADFASMKDRFKQRGETTTQTADGLVPQMGATLCRFPYSVSNELRALRMLQDATKSNLGRYVTTLAEDDRLLLSRKAGCLSNEYQNALILRREEKTVLHHFNTLATMALHFLEVNGDFGVYKGMLDASLESSAVLTPL